MALNDELILLGDFETDKSTGKKNIVIQEVNLKTLALRPVFTYECPNNSCEGLLAKIRQLEANEVYFSVHHYKTNNAIQSTKFSLSDGKSEEFSFRLLPVEASKYQLMLRGIYSPEHTVYASSDANDLNIHFLDSKDGNRDFSMSVGNPVGYAQVQFLPNGLLAFSTTHKEANGNLSQIFTVVDPIMKEHAQVTSDKIKNFGNAPDIYKKYLMVKSFDGKKLFAVFEDPVTTAQRIFRLHRG